LADHKPSKKARRVRRLKDETQSATAALSGRAARRSQLEILSLFGTIDYDPTYDYKAERRRKR
jgi:hypothetical protein